MPAASRASYMSAIAMSYDRRMCLRRTALAALTFLGLALLGLTSAADAQPERKMPPGLEPPPMRFAKAPELGQVFPNVTVVDDQGQPVNIRSLAAEKPYTVLTLGCLT